MSEIQAELPPLEERPLVTFALFAYNQEKYIREAIEGAFAQTYEPLEIILSDDCSTDRTFEIMEEMAAGYEGPHRLIVRQSKVNRGLASHINDVASIANGQIVVMAAGDDISLPDRTRELVRIYEMRAETAAACSDFFSMSDDCIQVKGQESVGVREFTLLRHLLNVGGWGVGATYSYRRECFFWPSLIPKDIEMEDRVLPTRAALQGRVAFTKAKLVRYRTPAESGQFENKSNWKKALKQGPVRRHLIQILNYCMKKKRISVTRWIIYFGVVNISFIRTISKAEKDNSLRNKFLFSICSVALSPFLLIRKFQRLGDAYAPLSKWKRGVEMIGKDG